MMNVKPYIPYMAAILVAVIIMMMFKPKKEESYRLRPSAVEIEEKGDESIFNLPNEMKCVPGPQPEASAYTKGLTPGGICGAQEAVAATAEYEIKDGIGGSLIEE